VHEGRRGDRCEQEWWERRRHSRIIVDRDKGKSSGKAVVKRAKSVINVGYYGDFWYNKRGCLDRWLDTQRELRRLVSLDGKTIRGSANGVQKARHVVSMLSARGWRKRGCR